MLQDLFNTPSPEQISQVISHSIAPSFLLGAVAGFVSVLFTRLTNIVERIRDLEQRGAHRQRRSLGSSDSRRPSPSRLMPSTLSTIARPGKIARCGARAR